MMLPPRRILITVLFIAMCSSIACRMGGTEDRPSAIDTETPPPPDEETDPPDTTPPETTLNTAPEGNVGSIQATFTFACNEKPCTFECRLDGAPWRTCTSPDTVNNLSDGEHRFDVRAIDAADNVDKTPASRLWTVDTTVPPFTLALRFERIPQPGLDPFRVVANLTQGGAPVAGKMLTLHVPRGTQTAVTQPTAGTYAFTVTPATTGIYPVTVTYQGVTVTRQALVLTTVADGLGQPMLVPGLVNTAGYEDGITITPDGEFLFVQYGPFYFSGLFQHAAICAEAGWSMYDLTTCPGKQDSDWVFNTIGPYATSERPLFPTGAINDGELMHLGLTIPTVVNRLVLFPTVFYGFRRQADGSFAEPFKIAFNDAKGANGPYGLSFQMLDTTHARFVVAWNNYFQNLETTEGQADVYHGVVTMGVTNNLGDVAYNGDFFASIDPYVSPVSFSSHDGVQGNPHLYYDAPTGTVKSIWTDDEVTSHDVAVYRLTAGAFPDGTWALTALPPKINTGASESQPFFTGSHLIVNRDITIVAHEYVGTGGSDYDLDASWGDAVTLLASGEMAVGGILGVGEPTIATYMGKTYLYFAYVESREYRAASGRYDFDLGAAVVELPVGYGR